MLAQVIHATFGALAVAVTGFIMFDMPESRPLARLFSSAFPPEPACVALGSLEASSSVDAFCAHKAPVSDLRALALWCFLAAVLSAWFHAHTAITETSAAAGALAAAQLGALWWVCDAGWLDADPENFVCDIHLTIAVGQFQCRTPPRGVGDVLPNLLLAAAGVSAALVVVLQTLAWLGWRKA